MAYIQFTKTYFQKPATISLTTYTNLKAALTLNPNVEIDPEAETFSQHFKGSLLTILISFVLAILCFVISGDDGPLIAVGGLSMMVGIFTGIVLLLEGPSYASYIKQRKDYFNRMKYAIIKSSSYEDFKRLLNHF